MRHRHYAFAAWRRHGERIDPVELVDRITGTVQDVIDVALDSMFDVMDRVDIDPDDLRARAESFAARFTAGCEQPTEWRDDDDPGEALR